MRHSRICETYTIQRNHHREYFAARKLPCPGLTIIKQSTRHYNTGNLLEKRASVGNYDAPSSSTYVGSERSRREINEIPFARAGAIQRLSPRGVDRVPARMREASQLPSFSFSRSHLLSVCRRRQLLRRYFNPSGHLPPAHCGIKFPYCHAMRPRRSAIANAQRWRIL